VSEASRAPRHVLTILAVADLDRAVDFYREAFGWTAQVETAVYVELALPDGRRFGLYERKAFARNTGKVPAPVAPGDITGTEIYLHCDDLEAAISRLEAVGARKLSGRAPRDWGDEAAYYADPDGNVLVVAKPTG
jgi:predicted enzyme related to lactoylglutathione lyase